MGGGGGGGRNGTAEDAEEVGGWLCIISMHRVDVNGRWTGRTRRCAQSRRPIESSGEVEARDRIGGGADRGGGGSGVGGDAGNDGEDERARRVGRSMISRYLRWSAVPMPSAALASTSALPSWASSFSSFHPSSSLGSSIDGRCVGWGGVR